MNKIEINQAFKQETKTFEQLHNEEFDSKIVAFNEDNDAVFLIIPACDFERQNAVIFIGDDDLESTSYRSWDDDEKFHIKELINLHLKLTV